jgi:hypothetical protein
MIDRVMEVGMVDRVMEVDMARDRY